MDFKAWFLSKTVWLNVFAFLAGVAQLGADFVNGNDFSVGAIWVLAVAVVNLVLRIWFTDKPIG